MNVTLMDCTLRDGANVVGKGFDAQLTDLMLDGLTAAHVPIIEFGNAGGIGAYEVAGFTAAETDQTYLDIGRKYVGRGSQLGMFLNAKRYREKNVPLAKVAGLSFLGLGVEPPAPEWGSILSSARMYMREAWHISLFPGIAIVLCILSLNLLGDGLRDALDPKQKR